MKDSKIDNLQVAGKEHCLFDRNIAKQQDQEIAKLQDKNIAQLEVATQDDWENATCNLGTFLNCKLQDRIIAKLQFA